jgi:hypothetical protein
MYSEDTLICVDILNRKRIAHAQLTSVWIVSIKVYFLTIFFMSQFSGLYEYIHAFRMILTVPFHVVTETAMRDLCLSTLLICTEVLTVL